jgi:hypothetical protein
MSNNNVELYYDVLKLIVEFVDDPKTFSALARCNKMFYGICRSLKDIKRVQFYQRDPRKRRGHRYLRTPCCSCGKTIVEFRDKDGTFIANRHFKRDEDRRKYWFYHMKSTWLGLPLYKCYVCKRCNSPRSKRSNPAKYCRVAVFGKHFEPYCKIPEKECWNWEHWTVE